MTRDDFKTVSIITATRGYYLKLKDTDNSEGLIGMPERILFSNKGNIPEFDEEKLPQVEEKVEEVKTTKKSTKKK